MQNSPHNCTELLRHEYSTNMSHSTNSSDTKPSTANSALGPPSSIFIYFYVYLTVPALSRGSWDLGSSIFSAPREIFSCSMWGLVPQPGAEPGSPALEACSLSH